MVAEEKSRFGMGGHQGPMKSSVWLTPKWVLDALGPFDLDPCASTKRPWPTATHHFTEADDGLSQEWFGRCWVNPPYGRHTATWLERLALHGNGTALIFARTDTDTWRKHVWPKASSVLFLYGRLRFCKEDGVGYKGSGAPSALVSYGQEDAEKLRQSGLKGMWIPLNNLPTATQDHMLRSLKHR